MAEAAGKGNAKQRAFFARKDRLDKEAKRAERQTPEQLKAEQAQKAERAKTAQARRDEARRAEFRAIQQRQADDRRKAANTKQAFNRNAEDRRAADAVRAETQRRAQAEQYARRQDQQRRDEERRKEQERKASLTADERKKAALDLRLERQARRDVRQQEAQARANMTFRQRQDTNDIRVRHKAERRGIAAEIAGHERDYLHKVGEIDVKERRTLAEFDNRRGTIRGRLDEMRRGKAAVDEQRLNLQIGFDVERAAVGHKLERLKDRLMQAEFRKPIMQAVERKEMMEAHSQERIRQERRHESDRPRQVAARKLVLEQVHERSHERELSLKR